MGSTCPPPAVWPRIFVGKPIPACIQCAGACEVAIEGDAAAIPDRIPLQPRDDAANDATFDDGDGMAIARDAHNDGRAGQQPVCGLDQHSCGRDIDNRHIVTRTNPGGLEAVRFPAVASMTPSIDEQGRHRAFHARSRRSNRSTRAFAVSPKIRMTNCESRRPRM